MLFKFPRRTEQFSKAFRVFSRVSGQLGLVVERIDVRWTALHAEKNHTLGLWREMRSFRGERAFLLLSLHRAERGECHVTETGSGGLESRSA